MVSNKLEWITISSSNWVAIVFPDQPESDKCHAWKKTGFCNQRGGLRISPALILLGEK